MGVPTGLREFIRYCGASTVNFNKEGKSKVKLELAALAKRVKSVVGTSSAESQGVSNFLRNRDIANKEQLQELPNGDKEDCRKDIGEPLRLRRRSRGLLPFIAGLKSVQLNPARTQSKTSNIYSSIYPCQMFFLPKFDLATAS